MADADNATKAPESDSQQDGPQTTAAPDHAHAQASSVVGEHCVTDRPTRTHPSCSPMVMPG